MIYFGKETFYVKSEMESTFSYQYHFVLITEEVGNDYWHLIENGAQEEAEVQNVYLEYVGPTRSNNEEKLEILDRMISAHVDGIIVPGIPGEQFNNLVKKAIDIGIPIITIDGDAPASERDVYVGTDNYLAGVLAGQTLVAETKGEQYVGVVVGTFDAPNQKLRLEGFKDSIEKETRIHLVEVVESNITEIGAIDATYSLMKKYPQMNAFFGATALDGVGIVQGVEEMMPKNAPYIIAFDTLPQTLDLIEQGKIQATIAQNPTEMGRQAVSSLIRVLNKEKVNRLQYTETSVIHKGDIKNGEIIPLEAEHEVDKR